MRELSIFVDESGGEGLDSRYYVLALVLHEQDRCLTDVVAPYERSLRDKGLPNIPLHVSPLLNGHDDYAHMELRERVSLLSSFMLLFHHLPIRYKAFCYRKDEFGATDGLLAAMRRDVVNFLFDNLAYLQGFDAIKVYYDGGQHVVTAALRDALAYALAREAVVYRGAVPSEYRLSQAADYVCAIELTALKYAAHRETATDRKVFGSWTAFKKNVLKTVRKKSM